jgi:hypothetical protein
MHKRQTEGQQQYNFMYFLKIMPKNLAINAAAYVLNVGN